MQTSPQVGRPSSSQGFGWQRTASGSLRRWIQQETETEAGGRGTRDTTAWVWTAVTGCFLSFPSIPWHSQP